MVKQSSVSLQMKNHVLEPSSTFKTLTARSSFIPHGSPADGSWMHKPASVPSAQDQALALSNAPIYNPAPLECHSWCHRDRPPSVLRSNHHQKARWEKSESEKGNQLKYVLGSPDCKDAACPSLNKMFLFPWFVFLAEELEGSKQGCSAAKCMSIFTNIAVEWAT